MWGASAGKWTFVITKDEEEFEFNVSVRTVGVPGGVVILAHVRRSTARR